MFEALPDLASVAVLMGCAFGGMVFHWLKRFFKSETSVGFVTFFKTNYRAVAGSFTVLISVIITTLATGTVEVTMASMGALFMAGYNLNSAFTPHDPRDGEPKSEIR